MPNAIGPIRPNIQRSGILPDLVVGLSILQRPFRLRYGGHRSDIVVRRLPKPTRPLFGVVLFVILRGAIRVKRAGSWPRHHHIAIDTKQTAWKDNKTRLPT